MHIKNKIFFISVVSILLLAYLSQQQLYLAFYSYPEEKIIHLEKVEKDAYFTTFIRHSVNLTPVYETYKIVDEHTIFLETVRLQDLGYGVPSTFDLDYEVYENFMIIDGFSKELHELPFRVSYINKPKVLLGVIPKSITDFTGKIIALDAFVGDGKRITINVIKKRKIYDIFYN